MPQVNASDLIRVFSPRVLYDNRPPLYGQFNRADRVWNTEPGGGAPAGWVCAVGGEPGIWEAIGGGVAGEDTTVSVTISAALSDTQLGPFDITPGEHIDVSMNIGIGIGVGFGPYTSGGPSGPLSEITSSNGVWVVAKEVDGSGNLVDQTGGGRDFNLPGGAANPLRQEHTGTDFFYFPGTASNTLTIAGLGVSTVYDFTVTYEDDTTDTGTATSDGSGNLVLGGTDAVLAGLKVQRIQVYPDGGGANVADLLASDADPDSTTFAEAVSSKTVTIGRSTTGRTMAVVNQPVVLFADDDYISASASTLFDIGASDDFSAVCVFRTHGNTGSTMWVASNGDSTTYWRMGEAGTDRFFANLDDGPNALNGVLTTAHNDTFFWKGGFSRDADGNLLTYEATSDESHTDVNDTGALDSGAPLEIGRHDGGSYFNGEFIGFAYIKGTAWTTEEIAAIADDLITQNGGTP